VRLSGFFVKLDMLSSPARHTRIGRARKRLARLKSSAYGVRIVPEIEQIPTRSGWFVPRERAGVQECVLLRSPVTEFQVIATTWRFWFFN
jgi:hypothetical protein